MSIHNILFIWGGACKLIMQINKNTRTKQTQNILWILFCLTKFMRVSLFLKMYQQEEKCNVRICIRVFSIFCYPHKREENARKQNKRFKRQFFLARPRDRNHFSFSLVVKKITFSLKCWKFVRFGNVTHINLIEGCCLEQWSDHKTVIPLKCTYLIVSVLCIIYYGY